MNDSDAENAKANIVLRDHEKIVNEECDLCTDEINEYMRKHPWEWAVQQNGETAHKGEYSCSHMNAWVKENRCNKSARWISDNTCQRTCFFLGRGYKGDNCCKSHLFAPPVAAKSTMSLHG